MLLNAALLGDLLMMSNSATHTVKTEVVHSSNHAPCCRPLGRRQKKSTAPTVMRRWMLVGITQLNPQDKLTRLVSQQQWQAALDLAMQHQLSPDDIYKCGLAVNMSQRAFMHDEECSVA